MKASVGRQMRTQWPLGAIALAGLVLALAGAGALVAAKTGAPKSAIAKAKQLAQRAPLTRWGDDLADPSLGHVPGEILVKFRKGRPWAAVAQASQIVKAEEIGTFPDIGVRHWRLADRRDPVQAIAVLKKSAAARWIEYAEPNYVLHVDDFPNDPMRGDLYGMHNVGQTGGTVDKDIDALEAWDAGFTGAPTVVVGVIDTGTDYNHPDLSANMWVNPGEIAGNGIDDDGNGIVDDIHGADFVNNDGDPMDDNGHGTHTAGTIGAVGSNDIGVVGVAWDVKIMALKFLSSGGSGSTANAIKCINYAKAKGAVITNNSWGGGKKSNALQDAISASNALFIASAGNSGSSQVSYPAGYSLDNIVSVAATDANDVLASFSNYSATWVDLGAPGVDTLSTVPNGGYGLMSGTSMAGPHVAGAAALLFQHMGGATVASVKARLLSTVDSVASLAGKCVSGGRLNLKTALGAPDFGPDSTPPDPIDDLTATANADGSITLDWTATGDDGGSGTAYLTDVRYRSVSELDDSTWTDYDTLAAIGEPTPLSAGGSQSFTLEGLRPGTTVWIAAKVTDEAGNTSTLSNVASATTASSGWTVRTVAPTGSSYIGFDFHPVSGHPAVAFGNYSAGMTQYTSWDGAAWTPLETVRTGYPGVSMAFAPDGTPTVTIAPGAVYFNSRGGASWTSTTIESRKAVNDVTWLAYDAAGNPAVCYRAGSLKFAKRVGGTWTKLTVPSSSSARYSCLAFDAAGLPGIAFSDDVNSDGWLDSISYAHYDGSSWTVELVDSGPVGYGVNAAVAFNPLSGRPAVAHRGGGSGARMSFWDGFTWTTETAMPSDDGYNWGCSIAFSADGTPLLASATGDFMKVAKRSLLDGVWTSEIVDYGSAFLFVLRIAPDGRLGMAFNGDGGLIYAEKAP